MNEMIGKLIIVSGPSGAGKGTICARLLQLEEHIVESVSATTRAPRINEIDGIHYFFITKERFLQMKAQNMFLETAEHFDNYYGTPSQAVIDNLNLGKDVLLEIDVVGALQVKANYPDSHLFFIMPPNEQALRQRLYGRNTETSDVIEKRLQRSVEEMKHTDKYDYIIVNDEVERATQELLSKIREIK